MSLDWLKTPYRAVVVGINAYDAPSIPDLSGCVADAAAVVALLEAAGMAKEDILHLSSPATDDAHKATRANILQGLRGFLGDAPAGSEVLFYYSGHGSYTSLAQEIALNGNRGETLVPADARQNNVLDILDLEMRVIRDDLVANGLQLTVIADSCFAGDVMRGDPKEVKEMAPRMTSSAHSGARTLATVLDGTVPLERLKGLYAQNDDNRYALVSGCLSTQQSYEIRLGDGKRGIMTTALVEALEKANAPLTYAELGQLLPAYVPAGALSKQIPNTTGNVEVGIFGTAVPLRSKRLFAAQAVTGTTVEFRVGLIVGVEVGSILRGYSDWTLEETLGTWLVTEAGANKATAVAEGEVTPPEAGQPFQLISDSSRPTIYFDPAAAKIQAAWYDDGKAGQPEMVAQVTATNANYVVAKDGDYFVTTQNGVLHDALRFAVNNPRAPYDMARLLNRVAAYESFVARKPKDADLWNLPALNDPNGVILTVEELDWNGNAKPVTGALGNRPKLRLTLTNNTGKQLWAVVYLLDQPMWIVERLFPDNDNNFYLADKTQAQATWNLGSKNISDWAGGKLNLKVILSSHELRADDMKRFPLGGRDTMRGGGGMRPVTLANSSGWVTYYLTIGE